MNFKDKDEDSIMELMLPIAALIMMGGTVWIGYDFYQRHQNKKQPEHTQPIKINTQQVKPLNHMNNSNRENVRR